jgi:hypothetical protein
MVKALMSSVYRVVIDPLLRRDPKFCNSKQQGSQRLVLLECKEGEGENCDTKDSFDLDLFCDVFFLERE